MAATLLYLQASPRGAESQSIDLADAYVSALRAHNPDLHVDTLQLWDESLPPFDQAEVSAKMAVITGRDFTDAQRATWEAITAFAQRFVTANRYVIAAPMWNGNIPYRLKRFIDIVHQPGITWTLNPQTGFTGLLAGKHATLVLTSGVYARGVAPGFGIDHHSTYLRDWLTEAGVTEIDEIRFQPTILTADPAAGFQRAREQAIELADRHGELSTI